MSSLSKILTIVGAIVVGTLGVLFVIKSAHRGGNGNIIDKVGKSLDERLQESRQALDKATKHFQDIVDHIKNQTPV